MTDEQLIAEYNRTREGSFFGELVRRRWRLLCWSAYRVVHNSTDAEDVVQQALVKIMRASDQFDGRAKVRTWMCSIVVREAIDLKRWKNADCRVHPIPIDRLSLSLRSDDAEPVDELIERDGRRILSRSLGQLPRDIRRVIELVDLQEVPYHLAAKKLGIPVGTVRSRRFRGIRKMRENMAA